MKRHEALVPLSHQHQVGLNAALHLERIDSEEARMTPFAALRNFVLFWERDGKINLRLEEEVLVPYLVQHGDAKDERILKMLTDHAELRSKALAAVQMERGTLYEGVERSGVELDHDLLRTLGALLRENIRFEEREVYPLAQETLPEAVLKEIGHQLPDTRWYADA